MCYGGDSVAGEETVYATEVNVCGMKVTVSEGTVKQLLSLRTS